MATLTIAPQALSHIRETIAARSMTEPVVLVAWNPGAADLFRGPIGEAIWERGPQGWVATIDDLAEIGPLDTPTTQIHGLSFLFATRPTDPSLDDLERCVKGGNLAIK